MEEDKLSSRYVKEICDRIMEELEKVIIGKRSIMRLLLIGLLSNGHILLEGVPGVAKTYIAKNFSKVLGLTFKRIQFTPDLLPSDIIGTYIFDQKSGDFKFRKGPIFSNIILADEINRAPPKTQSALLESMQEMQVSVEGNTFPLPRPFMVIATQNPIELEGSLPMSELVFLNGFGVEGEEVRSRAEKDGKILMNSRKGKLYEIPGIWTVSFEEREDRFRRRECMFYTMDYRGELLKIRTEKGREIEVTEDHPFLVRKNGMDIWMKAKELNVGDIILVPSRIPDTSESEDSGMDEELVRWLMIFSIWGSGNGDGIEVSADERIAEAFEESSFKLKASKELFKEECGRLFKVKLKGLDEKFRRFLSWDQEEKVSFLYRLNRKSRAILLELIGVYSSERDGKVAIDVNGKKLANALTYLLLKEGVGFSIEHRQNGTYRILIEGKVEDEVSLERISSIGRRYYEGVVFGLTVPGTQNYLGGLGACGINHNTYPLPEAQLDRFMFKVLVGYPDENEEFEILKLKNDPKDVEVSKVSSAEEVLLMQKLVRRVYVREEILSYIKNIVLKTRKDPLIELGGSPRASISILNGAKARAAILGRDYVTPDDVKAVAFYALNHRLILKPEAELEGISSYELILRILKEVKVPS
ncbi:MAG: AAA family ATPase [Candidatus Odinarchaeota archaeon]|nr:AAA family ATPase [Candidatus Odinarchaeota archaeon]